jgi:hypothetical protein
MEKLHNEELHNEVSGACGMHVSGQKSVQGFGGNAQSKDYSQE